MTTAAGMVRVPMTQAEALALLLWLRSPVPQDTPTATFTAAVRTHLGDGVLDIPSLPRILGDDDIGRTMAENNLKQVARYPRTHAQLRRCVAEYLAKLVPAAGLEAECGSAARSFSLAAAALPVLLACDRALRRRGRPRRSALDTRAAIERERAKLAEPSGGDVRLLRRLRKELRRHEWFDRNGLLTGTEPYPS